MKRLLLTIMALLPFGASADDGFYFKPYVGADYENFSINYNSLPGTAFNYGDFYSDSLDGGDVHVGARVHKYLGFEAGYFDTASQSKSNILGTTASSSIKSNGGTLDAMGYLPIGDAQKFELIGTAGVAYTTAKISLNFSGAASSASKSETKGRIGGGAQYWITDNLNIRGLVRYQDADFDGIANNVVISSLGLNWQF